MEPSRTEFGPDVFLSGPMGSGKSTIGVPLAERLAADFVDLDTEIERSTGKTIQEVFREQGEAAFRKLEAETLTRFLQARRTDEPQKRLVMALGGGTVLRAESRAQLLESGVVVSLWAPVEVLAERVASASGRPLLAEGDAKAILAALVAERRPAYAECHGEIRSDGPVSAVVDAVVSLVHENPVVVPLDQRTYRVAVGGRALSSMNRFLDGATGVLWVVDENVRKTPWVTELLPALNGGNASVVLPAGEEHKTIRTVETIWDAALEQGLDRNCVFVAVGGGVTGDLCGFAAATFLRGVRVVQVPTTLLAMVDSAVGGKTGFDRKEGKNLVGAFHQPSAVLCDLRTLSTLPLRELRAGLAEVVKTAWIESEAFVRLLERQAAALVAAEVGALEQVVRRCVSCKRDVVIADEREGGHRRLLNFGHTVGHALEAAGGYQSLLHGEAVALGMVAALKVGLELGVGSQVQLDRMIALLQALGLPHELPQDWDRIARPFLAADKKRVGSHIAFVFAERPGELQIRPVSLEKLQETLASAAQRQSK